MPEIIYRQIKEADYEDVIALINCSAARKAGFFR